METKKRFFAYARVSTEEQANSRNGLEAQKHRILQAVQAHADWSLVWIASDEGISAKEFHLRPAFENILKRLRAKEADGLIVHKVDRISRSLIEFVQVSEAARKQKWSLVILEPEINTGDYWGRFMINTLAVFAELERDMISARTKEGLSRARSRGVRLGGSTASIDPGTLQRMQALHRSGLSYRQIANTLNEESLPSPLGSKWYPATTRTSLLRHATAPMDRSRTLPEAISPDSHTETPVSQNIAP